MQHCDPETLALAALGERITPEDIQHLESCEQCAAEVAELTELVTLAREAPSTLPAAPDGIWEAIRGELGMGRDTLSDPASPAESPLAVEPSTESAGIVRMEPRSEPRQARRRMVAVAGIAASVGALLGGTVVWAALDRETPAEPEDRIVAQAVLDPLSPGVTQPGEAQVLETSDGLVVRVDARSLPASSGFHQVWLLDADATKLVSLGALPSGSVGTFTIPPGIVVADFPVVDISLEPYDGDPGHSSDSLMRGTLEA